MMQGYGYAHGLGFLPFAGPGMALLMLAGFAVAVGLTVWLVNELVKGSGARAAHAMPSTPAPPVEQLRYPTPAAPVRFSAPIAPSTPADPAVAIVRERYARGEIDRKQYEKLIADLG